VNQIKILGLFASFRIKFTLLCTVYWCYSKVQKLDMMHQEVGITRHIVL
jgi:hypothetical protein